MPPCVRLRLLLFLAGLMAIGRAAEPGVLRSARAVRELTAADADQAREAAFSGIVLGLAEPEGTALVVQNEAESIYLVGSPALVGGLRPGDRIEVRGRTTAGGFAPYLKIDDIRKTGEGPLPEPAPVQSVDLFTRGLDAQWIVVSGLVREIRDLRPDEVPRGPLSPQSAEGGRDAAQSLPVRQRMKLTLAIGDRLVPVQLHGPLDAASLVDAEVEVRGLCFNQHNAERQFLNPLILVPRGVELRVLQPAPAGPFDGPAVSSPSLFQFRPDGLSMHRVHIDGVVLHQHAGTGIWIRDSGHGLFVQTGQETPLEPGDRVQVAGFPERGAFSPILAHSIYRKSGREEAPRPTRLEDHASAARHNGDLVAIEGTLLERKETDDGLVLWLDWRGANVAAVCRRRDAVAAASGLEPGSLLSVAGICVVSSARSGPLSGLLVPDKYSLLVRQPGDLALVRAAPWWTGRRIALLLLGIIAALAAVLATVFFVSRRKIARERALRTLRESEYRARLAERSRMARDLHDSVAQGLGAISLQLELATASASGANGGPAHHLALAQQLVRTSMIEVRSFIRNLRTQTQQDVELASALEEVLRTAVEGSSIRPEFSVEGEVHKLPPAVEAQVIRITQEAVSNAVRHSGSDTLRVRLQSQPGALVVSITDDGSGFDNGADWGDQLHFGLLGMKERAALISATLAINAAKGRGTQVVLTVPYTARIKDSLSV